jgi:DNA repair exonuclease SbcCD ATPase subunit
VISHDRHFLNAVCTHIADIDYDTVIIYPGNYDDMVDMKIQARSKIESENREKSKKVAQLQDFVSRFGAGTRASQVQSRKKEIERLVGLNFEQFTRSVLLAQGDFTAFMKANKDEKSSLLEKLTGTHIYSEISKKIFEKHKTQDQILKDLNIRSQGIPTFSDEEIKEIKKEESILVKQIIQLSTEIEALSKEIDWHEQLMQLNAGKQIALENLTKAEAEIITSTSLSKEGFLDRLAITSNKNIENKTARKK